MWQILGVRHQAGSQRGYARCGGRVHESALADDPGTSSSATSRCSPESRSRSTTLPRSSSSPTITAHRAPALAAASSCRPSLRSLPSSRTRRPALAQLAGHPQPSAPALAGSAETTATNARPGADLYVHAPAPPAPPGRCRARSRSPASGGRRAAPPGRRSGRRRPAPAAARADRPRRTRTWCACSSPGRGRWSVDLVAHAEPIEQSQDGVEMVAARVAQVVDAARGAAASSGSSCRSSRTRSGLTSQPPPGVIGQAVRVRAEVVDQRLRDSPGGRSRRRSSSGTPPHRRSRPRRRTDAPARSSSASTIGPGSPSTSTSHWVNCR